MALALFVVVFYAEEDWRARIAWQKCQQRVNKNGDTLEMPMPAPIPDDQNFAASPIIAQVYSNFMDKDGNRLTRPWSSSWTNKLIMSVYHTNDSFAVLGDGPFSTNQTCWLQGKHVNLEWWQSYYRHGREISYRSPRLGPSSALGQGPRVVRHEAKTNLVAYDFPVPLEAGTAAADVLFALGQYAITIEEIRKAAKRPLVKFPVHYNRGHPDDLLVTGMGSLRGCLDVLSLRAVAELQDGKSDSAADDVLLGLRLTRYAIEPLQFSSRPPAGPFLTAILQPLWEGLADHEWSETQTVAFDSELAQMNFVGACQRDIKAHRAQVLDVINQFQRKNEQGVGPFDGDGDSDMNWAWNGAFRLAPSGWYDQNRFESVSLYQPLLAVLDPSHAQVRAAGKAGQTQIRNPSWNPCQLLADMLFVPPDLASYAFAQTEVNLARLACALERYRIDRGEFPKKLDLLAPKFVAKVPGDVAAPGEYHYELKNGTNLLLYSVGWNDINEHLTVYVGFNGGAVRRNELAWRYR